MSTVEPTLEMAGRFSRVLRVRVGAGTRNLSIFIKRYEPRSGTPDEAVRFRRYVEREYSRLLLAANCTSESATVARPIACLPDEFAIVTEEASGMPLQRLFKRLAIVRTPSAREKVEQALTRVSAWLRDFQAGVPPVKTRTRDFRKYLDIRLLALVRAQRPGFGEAERAEVLAFFDAHHARLTSGDLAPVAIHADLCPSNILVSDDGITVLDLAMSDVGTRYQDLADVCFHLELAARRFLFGASLLDRLRDALLQSFEPGLDARAPLFQLMRLQHAFCHLAELARHEPVLANAFSEWRWKSRVAWCLDITGVRSGN